MEVILLERVANLGNVGDIAKVRNGYARNYLIPLGKALRANEQSKKEFEARRAQIEEDNASKKKDAEKQAGKLEGQFIVLIRQAGEDGRLYGSVNARDIAAAAAEATKVAVDRSQVAQFTPIKALGINTVKVALHPEVIVSINVNVARSEGEAEDAKKEFLNPKTKKPEGEAAEAEGAEAAVESEEVEGKHKKKKKKIAKIVDVELEDESASPEEAA